jgi:multidrug efflux pump subunit AcrB
MCCRAPPGVGEASLFGTLNYSMRIWFDTKRLDSLKLTPADVIGAIQAQNVQAPVGRIGARPIGNDQQFQMNVQTQGRLTTPEQFGNIVLRANPDGSFLRVRDIARVELGAQNQDVEARINGRPAVGIRINLSPGANAIRTATLVRANLDRLSQNFPAGLKYLVSYDTTTFVQDTIRDVWITLGIAFVLVVIVVFLFLGSLRATLIPAIAVPVSLIGSFAVLLAMGYTANTVSLLAMVLAIGILVDDAIVVHFWSLSAGCRARRRRDQPPRRRYTGFRRDDRRKRDRTIRNPDALCHLSEPAREQRRVPPTFQRREEGGALTLIALRPHHRRTFCV